jgi:hypothetical protein
MSLLLSIAVTAEAYLVSRLIDTSMTLTIYCLATKVVAQTRLKGQSYVLRIGNGPGRVLFGAS